VGALGDALHRDLAVGLQNGPLVDPDVVDLDLVRAAVGGDADDVARADVGREALPAVAGRGGPQRAVVDLERATVGRVVRICGDWRWCGRCARRQPSWASRP